MFRVTIIKPTRTGGYRYRYENQNNSTVTSACTLVLYILFQDPLLVHDILIDTFVI